MPAKKRVTTNDNTNESIQVLKEDTCPTSSGKSTLTYKVGVDGSDGIHLKISNNDGGGFWSAEWVSYDSIRAALDEWPEDQGVTSMVFRQIFRGKSANTPGFLVAVLNAAGLLEPMGDKKRVHQACDPAAFLAHVDELRGNKPKAKPRAKAKTKAKAPSKRPSTRKKSPARSKKAS